MASSSYTEIYMHFCWATKCRQPILTRPVARIVHKVLHDACLELRCQPVAIGGIEDHVHMFTRMHPSVAPSDLAKEAKSLSSLAVNDRLGLDTLEWQTGYAAFSVYRRAVDIVANYVRNQAERHRTGKIFPDFEVCTTQEGLQLPPPPSRKRTRENLYE